MTGVCCDNIIASVLSHTDHHKGKIGKDSAAAKYAAATPSDTFSIQEDKPYAEVGHSRFHLHGFFCCQQFSFLAMDGHPSFATFQGPRNWPIPP